MDMKHIEKGLLVERYLLGDLSPEEEAEFEEAMIASPELLDQLEAADRLRGGLKDLNAVEGIPGTGRHLGAKGMSGGVGSVFSSPRFAMAASALLAVSVVFSAAMYRQNQSLETALASNGSVPTQVQALYTVRSATGDEPVNVVTPAPGGQVVLLVDPGFEPYDAYRGTLLRLDGGSTAESLHELEGLQPGYEEMLAVALPSRLLTPGRYEILVEGRSVDASGATVYETVTRVDFLSR